MTLNIEVVSNRYISFDGPDGAGKTTAIKKLKKTLEEQGHDVVLVREAGHTDIGVTLRSIVLEKDLGFEKSIHLFIADRIVTQHQVVTPALNAGKIVLSDRTMLASCVYQGYMYNKFQEALNMHAKLHNFIYPNIGLIAQIPIEECERRLNGRNEDWIERKPRSYHEEIHACFNRAHEWAPFPVRYVDFNQTDEQINADILSTIQHIL